MSELIKVKITSIDANPLRRLEEYPYKAEKIEALRQSIRDVGLWEGVIGRKAGNRVQIAFGHHRIEAARQELGNDARVPIIVRDLDDEQMLGFMGRENLEDYDADFLIMLESWEAAKTFARAQKNPQTIDTPKLLGWLNPRGYPNHTARACNAASELIEAGHLKSTQLKGLSVKSVGEICQHIKSRHKQLEEMGRVTNRPAKEVERAKKDVSGAVDHVVKKLRKGDVAQKQIRGALDVEAYEHAREAKRQTPLFSAFIKRVAEGIGDMLKSDSYAEKLSEIRKHLNDIEMEEDAHGVDVVHLECEHLSKRAAKWATAMIVPARKVAQLKAITSRRDD